MLVTAVDILQHAFDYLNEGQHRWTKNAWAKNEQHENVAPNSPTAKCHCALGAIERSGRILCTRRVDAWNEAETLLASVISDGTGATPDLIILSWNDRGGRKYEEVLKAFQRAIAKGKEQSNG